ncbi:PAS domain S-box protein [Bradyrhizobium liaoningense]|nr:PAS domain S-box protein [Bradyrhizobium liaoningense]
MIELERKLLLAAIDALDAGVAILDRDQRVIGWNDWLASASGVTAPQAGKRTLAEIFPGKLSTRLAASISEALELNSSSFLTHTLNRNLLPLRTRAGLEMLHNISVRPLGTMPDLSCVVQIVDVTASAHRERVLRERQNARYDAVVESAPDAIFTVDAPGLIQFANPSALRELGYTKQELIGRPLSALFDNSRRWDEFWRDVLDNPSPPRAVELVARRANGSSSYLEVSASRWLSAGRVFVTAILHDVNERHAAEKALRTLNSTLELRVAERTQERDQIWQVSQDMLGVASINGVWISVNPAWERILGWSSADILGKTSEWLEHPDDVRAFRAEFDRLAAAEKTFNFENTMRTRSGDYRVLAWTAVNADGLLYCVARDITEQRRQEDALAKAEDALRQSQKMEAVGQLTGGLAHDFNNLLTGISGSLELLQIRIAQARYKDVDRYISMARGAANRAAALTHRLLAFSRRQTLDPKATDVNRLVAGMRDLINNTVGPAIEVKTVEGSSLWATLVDPNQLENALLNLCINARDAMPDGGTITIETDNCTLNKPAAAEREMKAGEYVVLSVSDTGIGMTDEVIQRAFDPFYTTKPLGQGTGLGLSMIYGFAKQSGGQVRISSKLGAGTTVHILLPRHDERESAADDVGDFAAAPRAGAGETVLIVDDEPSVRMLVTEVLAELGYTAIEAADGSSALRVLQSDVRIDLLVTDVGLPGGMNGRQLADFGRLDRPKLKVLFITGYAEKSVFAKDRPQEGMGILTKPFAMDSLAARIKELIATKG